MTFKTILPVLLLTLAGCTTTPSIADKSKTVDEYLTNTSITSEDGGRIYDQYAMKAVLIGEIIENTEWPEGKKDTVKLCVIGDDDFRGKLNKVAKILKEEKGYNLDVKRGIRESDVKYCDVLFAGFMYVDRELRGYLNRASGHPVLTIGDDKYFEYHGGMITFNRPDSGQPERLKVNINMEAVEKAGLSLNSDLVEIADNVKY